ncbi:MAG TPA: magnesium transporter [Motiliproteus sp.]
MSDELNQVIDRLREVEEQQRPTIMESAVDDLEPDQVALLLEALPLEERLRRWHEIPGDDQREVLMAMRVDARTTLLRTIDENARDLLLDGLDAQELIELADSLPERLVEEALSRMDAQQRDYFERANQYHDDQIGRYVDHELLMLPASVRVQDADRLLRRTLPDYTDSLFLYDRSGRYSGTVRTAHLYTVPGHLPLSSQADEEAESLQGDTSLSDAADAVMRCGWVALPVVDDQGRLLGRVTLRDAMELQREQLEGQIMAQAGMSEEEDLFAPVLRSSRRRATWLGLNLLTAFLASWSIGLFQATLQQVVALAVLMPIVASMGGIAGSQTLTLMIRALALKQIARSNLRLLLYKEIGVAAVNGLVWALLIALICGWWFSSPALGAVIGVAIALNILAAALAGVMIPILLERLQIDPALSGSVILTTVTDVIGFVSFLGLGALVLV